MSKKLLRFDFVFTNMNENTEYEVEHKIIKEIHLPIYELIEEKFFSFSLS